VPKCGGAPAKFPAREEVVRGEIFTAGTGTRGRKREDAETKAHSQTEVFIAEAELVASRDRRKPQWRPRLPEAEEMRGRDAVTADRGEEGIISSIAKNSEERKEVSSRRERRTRSKKRQRLMNIEEKRVRRGESERRRNAGNRGQKGRRSNVSQST